MTGGEMRNMAPETLPEGVTSVGYWHYMQSTLARLLTSTEPAPITNLAEMHAAYTRQREEASQREDIPFVPVPTPANAVDPGNELGTVGHWHYWLTAVFRQAASSGMTVSSSAYWYWREYARQREKSAGIGITRSY